jgi:hypothetical protein
MAGTEGVWRNQQPDYFKGSEDSAAFLQHPAPTMRDKHLIGWNPQRDLVIEIGAFRRAGERGGGT